MFGERINQCSHLFDLWELIQLTLSFFPLTSQVVSVVKNLPANAGGVRNTGSIQGSGRFPGGGNENLFQYSCLKNPMDREAWWATVHRVAQSQTQSFFSLIINNNKHFIEIFSPLANSNECSLKIGSFFYNKNKAKSTKQTSLNYFVVSYGKNL